MSETIKGISIRRHCCIISSVEYTKLPSGVRPTNNNMAECLSGDTEIYNWESGVCERIDQIKPGTITGTLNTETFKIEPQKILDLLDKGIQDVYEVTTKTGRKLKTTLNHPFFIGDRWEKLSNLKVRDTIAIPKNLKFPRINSINPNLARLLGYLAGDGHYGLRNKKQSYTPGFINSTKEYYEDVISIVNENFPMISCNIRNNKGSKDIRFSYKRGHQNPLLNWLKELNIAGQTEENKTIPECILSGNEEIKSNYISGLFATDGNIFNSKKNNSRRIKLSTTSMQLAKQTQRILMHLGIQSSMGYYAKRINSKEKLDHYTVTIKNKFINIFFNKIPIKGYKKENLDIIVSKTNHEKGCGDPLPPVFCRKVKKYRENNNLRSRMKKNTGYYIQKNRLTNQSIANKMIEENFISSEFSKWINSDIFWDQIKSIEYLGKEHVWDLTIENTHNFIANDIFCHNTGQIEYDASAIIHLYSDVSDNPESFTVCHEEEDWQGQSIYLPRIECIIGKNKITEVKKSFFLDFFPASSDYRRVTQKEVLEGVNKMKQDRKNGMIGNNQSSENKDELLSKLF